MSVSEGYWEFVLEQLEGLGEITSKRMFGAVGIWCEGAFFAIIDDDVLYLKVDDVNRPDFEELRMSPFRYESANKKFVTMQYYQVPADVLENADELQAWAARSVAAARRKRDG